MNLEVSLLFVIGCSLLFIGIGMVVVAVKGIIDEQNKDNE